MRWVVAPIAAALLMTGSGFLDSLERTTVASTRLADASAEAPKESAAAAEELESLPDIARLTARQADAFRALADALDASAQRVIDLNEELTAQVAGITQLGTGIREIKPFVECVGRRLRALLTASEDIPGGLASITATVGDLRASQDKAVRHLKSINRKLTALGVAAAASGVEPPPPPGDAPAPDPGEAPEPLDC